MLSIQYRLKFDRRLNLKNPTRYGEKIQWYKLYYRDPIMHECVDKFLVRQYVESKGLSDTLVKLYGVYDSIEEVDFTNLPESFVIKLTCGGGGLDVVLCTKKNELDIEELKRRFHTQGDVKSQTGGREWAYYGLKKRIVVEELLLNPQNPQAGVNDYKFYCFDGEPKAIAIDVGRYTNHRRYFYDTKWNDLHVFSEYPGTEEGKFLEKPENFEKMLEVAKRLSEDFPHVRVDLYNIEGRIYFGELTFYPYSGYAQFNPDEFDVTLGKYFNLRRYNTN